MAQHDFSQLKSEFPNIILQMPKEFSSHQFILMLSQKNQGLYIDALNTYRADAAPFQTVHGILSKALNEFSHLVEKSPEEVDSEDIWRQSNRCAYWIKR